MKKIKILWNGITGRTGIQALIVAKKCNYAEIVAGICRNDGKYYNYDELGNIKEEFDVIIDFSHRNCFDKILAFAVKAKKPFITGTAKLSEKQEKAIEHAAKIIPIFRGGNFRFEVKKFIDSVIEYAKNNDKIVLIERTDKHYASPSQTAGVIAKKVLSETGKTVLIDASPVHEEHIYEWQVGNLYCKTIGMEKLVKDVFQIASMMVDKKAGKVWDLDRLLSNIKLEKQGGENV